MPAISEVGAIRTLKLPDEWVLYPKDDLPGRRLVQQSSPYDNPAVMVRTAVRGVELSIPGREAYMRTLYSEFHQLNQAEINDLREVLEGMSAPRAFVVDQANTAYLNSRRVIQVTGTWTKQKVKELSFFIDVAGDSRHVQQLSFIAPIVEFKTQVDWCLQDIFLTVAWN